MLPNPLRPSSGDDEGEWIMSYADTVTLLLCFFVIFFSESDMTKEHDVKVELEKVIEEKEALVIELEEAKIKSEESEKKALDLMKVVRENLRKQKMEDFELTHSTQSVSIRLKEKGFFNESSFKVLPKGREALLKVANSLDRMDERFRIHVEGHTDSKPVSASAYYFSNLGLSSLRASNAAEILISMGVERSRVQSIGFGDSRPVAKDRIIASETEEVTYNETNSSKNRRIEIRLVFEK